MKEIENAAKHFSKLLEKQLKRVEQIKNQDDFIDYDNLKTIKVGIIHGDGIGLNIVSSAERILKTLLKEEIEKNKVELKTIEGLTIENRSKERQSVPFNVLTEIKNCDVILKGPTTTPRKGDGWPYLESANVVLRKELDLFCNIRPIKVKEKNIDWVFFRENTEGAYTLGSLGLNILNELFVDFTITTRQGSERIARAAFEYAKKTGRKKVSIITKANIIKTTDGNFLEICKEIAKNYEGIEVDDWYVDIAAAKLMDEQGKKDFNVLILPNLYGDILTDEAAQIQGGVGTAGSANIGNKYAMFEAVHGSAPRMVRAGLANYANPTSILRAVVLMLNHIGFSKKAIMLEKALDFCSEQEPTGYKDAATTKEFTEYIISNLN